jgi:hypothetical protein
VEEELEEELEAEPEEELEEEELDEVDVAAQMEANWAVDRGAGSFGRPDPGSWNRHPSTSPVVIVPEAPALAYDQVPWLPVKYDQ